MLTLLNVATFVKLAWAVLLGPTKDVEAGTHVGFHACMHARNHACTHAQAHTHKCVQNLYRRFIGYIINT